MGAALLASAIAGIVTEPRITSGGEGGAHRDPATIMLLVGCILGEFALGTVRGIPHRWLILLASGSASMVYASGIP